MHLTKEEYKILNYVKKQNHISKSELLRKFPHLSNPVWKKHINMFLEEIDENRRNYEEECLRIEDENCERVMAGLPLNLENPKLSDNPNNVFYYLNLTGKEKLEEHKREFWGFILPYSITTIIAFASLLAQFM